MKIIEKPQLGGAEDYNVEYIPAPEVRCDSEVPKGGQIILLCTCMRLSIATKCTHHSCRALFNDGKVGGTSLGRNRNEGSRLNGG